MGRLEYLIKYNPDKTGKEILEMHQQDLLKEEQHFNKLHSENLKIVEKIKANPIYVKGQAGNQYWFWRIYNARYNKDQKEIIVTFDNIVLFSELNSLPFSFERQKGEFDKYSNLAIHHYEEVTETEWNKINDFINNIPTMFWGK